MLPGRLRPLACSSSDDGSVTPTPPGGSAGASTLKQHNLLVSGQVQAGEAAGSQPVQQALCGYVFGSPEAVTKEAKLTGTATLTPESGFQVLGSNGDSYECIYTVGGTTTLLLEIRTEPTTDKITGTGATQVQARGLQAVLAYKPDYSGPTIAKTDATSWLTAAIGRVKTNQ